MTFRPARVDDAAALRDLEREANLVGLAHVFPAADFPFPDDDVMVRWQHVLAEPGVVVDVVDGPGGAGGQGLDAFVAHDARTLRHLAVHPRRWGTGLARVAVERAASAITDGGQQPRLWCLAANERALGLYLHLGWEPTGVERCSEWTPYPVERELVLRGSADV
ncbi:GNAT family N-acetyltransferase [Nocardioides sp.]|uniref:GNAT family N-acetyltransferase n=1 Tax=Nocardioides sp. TaxID=35761 RepID=UPI00286A5D7D|nr:GNAT family N-acetyltransferase [Nocardioides sp.]